MRDNQGHSSFESARARALTTPTAQLEWCPYYSTMHTKCFAKWRLYTKSSIHVNLIHIILSLVKRKDMLRE